MHWACAAARRYCNITTSQKAESCQCPSRILRVAPVVHHLTIALKSKQHPERVLVFELVDDVPRRVSVAVLAADGGRHPGIVPVLEHHHRRCQQGTGSPRSGSGDWPARLGHDVVRRVVIPQAVAPGRLSASGIRLDFHHLRTGSRSTTRRVDLRGSTYDQMNV